MSEFQRFVPASARAVVDVDGPALLSGQLLARFAERLEAPVLELSARRGAALVGFLRACKHEDALAVVSVDGAVRRRSPRAPGAVVEGILTAAAEAAYTGPLVLVARDIEPEYSLTVPDDVRLRERIARDVEAGFTSIGVAAGALAEIDEWSRVTPMLEELDLGLELEVGPDDDAALLLAQLDDLGLPLSAVRGASPFDEIGSAALVVDVKDLTDGMPLALRVCIDAVIDDIGDDDVVEARAWMATTRALQKLRARDTATRLEDVLGELRNG